MAIKDIIGAGIGFSPGAVNFIITRGLSGGTSSAPAVGSIRRRNAYQRLLKRRERELVRLEAEQATVQTQIAALPKAEGKRKWATLGVDHVPALDRVRLQGQLMEIASQIERQRSLLAVMISAIDDQEEEEAMVLLI